MVGSRSVASGRIFISYRRAESAYSTAWLYERLASHFGREDIVRDIDSIEPGDDFVRVIGRAVASCDVMLAVIGTRWISIKDDDGRRRLDLPDDFVRREIEAGLERDIRVIPILVDGATMPSSEQLPPSLAKLTRRQALELSPQRFQYDTDRLLRVLDKTISEEKKKRHSDDQNHGATQSFDRYVSDEIVSSDQALHHEGNQGKTTPRLIEDLPADQEAAQRVTRQREAAELERQEHEAARQAELERQEHEAARQAERDQQVRERDERQREAAERLRAVELEAARGEGQDQEAAQREREAGQPEETAGHDPRPSTVVRVRAVVLAAVLLAAGVGVVIALRDPGTVVSPPVTSATPSAPVSVVTSSPSANPTPSRTPDPFVALPASAPLDDQVIVWARKRNGNWDIALLDLRTDKETRLTKGETVDWGPVISRNRRTIIYTRIVHDRPTTRVMAADGTGDRLLFDKPPKDCSPLSRPAVARSGQLVVRCQTEEPPRTIRLLVVTLEGKIVRELDEGRLGDPTVTADGRWVLYWRNDEGDEHGGSIYRTQLDGRGSPARITNSGNGEDADPAISSDGTQLAFSRDDGNGRNIMTAPFDGQDLTGKEKAWTETGDNLELSWSPDGRSIAFTFKREPNDNGDLYVLDLGTGKSRHAVQNPETDSVPAWTPR
jgi:dipeptidyl aminopeptidase/acylaminoacyl peptidase